MTDLDAAKAVYTALLGAEPTSDTPYYVGHAVAGQQIGLVPGGSEQGMTGPVAYWHVPDIKEKLAEVTVAGATVKDEPATSAAAAWWPRSPTPTATSWACCRTAEHPLWAWPRRRTRSQLRSKPPTATS